MRQERHQPGRHAAPAQPAGRIEGGEVIFQGQDLLSLDESEMRELRGKEIAMIFQDPMTSLNPVLTIEEQMVETIRAHRRVSKSEARARTLETPPYGRHPSARGAAPQLPAPVQRRHAPARDDRHGAGARAQAAHRRRADDGPRRHDPGAGPRAAPAPRGGPGDGRDPDHPRSGRRGRHDQARQRDVRGLRGRERLHARSLCPAAAPLHGWLAALDAAFGCPARRAPHPYRGVPPTFAAPRSAARLRRAAPGASRRAGPPCRLSIR